MLVAEWCFETYVSSLDNYNSAWHAVPDFEYRWPLMIHISLVKTHEYRLPSLFSYSCDLRSRLSTSSIDGDIDTSGTCEALGSPFFCSAVELRTDKQKTECFALQIVLLTDLLNLWYWYEITQYRPRFWLKPKSDVLLTLIGSHEYLDGLNGSKI